ncbi:DUF167 domain-containing protein [Candidatus Woesearchaeota archaeon]|nr:DUF167 domain-containing protein [Candidatus Woesearchaeota archaeon]
MSKINLLNEIRTKSSIMLIVRTNSNKTQINSFDTARQAYVLDVAAPPQDNKANIEIVKFFKRELGKDIRILSGATAKKKLIRLI